MSLGGTTLYAPDEGLLRKGIDLIHEAIEGVSHDNLLLIRQLLLKLTRERLGQPLPERLFGAVLGRALRLGTIVVIPCLTVNPWLTVRQAIGDLPQPVGTEIRAVDWPLNIHFGRTPTPVSLRRYKAIPEQGMNRFDLQKKLPRLTPRCWIRKKTGGTDLFGRLWWDRPAFTVRTEFFKPEKGRYLHPEQHRPITHREAARFQSFPDSFAFEGSKIEIAKQIGNAVPPVLAARLADCVYCMLQYPE